MAEIDKPILGGGGSIQSNSIDPKTSVLSGYSLSTSAQTIVGAINEILPKATGVGKVDPNSNGTGEVFNSYKGDNANVASGNYSHAEGIKTNATGDYSHAEGYDNSAESLASHAEGSNTTASGAYSHAEGSNTTASGGYSHAEGRDTEATGTCSHSEGLGNRASGAYSHAEGSFTQAFSESEHAEGIYNVSNTGDTEDLQTRHSVGIGTSYFDCKNAHEIMANGDHYIYGIGGYDGKMRQQIHQAHYSR